MTTFNYTLLKRSYTNILVFLVKNYFNQSTKYSISRFNVDRFYSLQFDIYLKKFELVANSLIVGMLLMQDLGNCIHRRIQDCQPKHSLPKREHRWIPNQITQKIILILHSLPSFTFWLQSLLVQFTAKSNTKSHEPSFLM